MTLYASMIPADVTHWLPVSPSLAPDCLCVGTGRFLRAVLVPVLVQSGYRPALIQPRGRTFLEFIVSSQQQQIEQPTEHDLSSLKRYPVETVLASGEVQTDHIPIYGAFSLGSRSDRIALMEQVLPRLTHPPKVVGVGVTEAGLVHSQTPVMKDLYDLLLQCRNLLDSRQWTFHPEAGQPEKRNSIISILNTDNVPLNGDVLRQHMMQLASSDPSMTTFLKTHIHFHNTMVDRITSHSPDNVLIPRAEPMPHKALVILDPDHLLYKLDGAKGVVLRSRLDQLQVDVELKLRVANGTHTALAHMLALLQVTMTDDVVRTPVLAIFIEFLDSLVEHAIVPAWVGKTNVGHDPNKDRLEDVHAVYRDWRQRLWHPHFGLSTFFITQNGAAKGGLRLGPTIRDLITRSPPRYSATSALHNHHPRHVPVSVALAFAALLRWLTPLTVGSNVTTSDTNRAYRGWLQPSKLLPPREDTSTTNGSDTSDVGSNHVVEYADRLCYNFVEGWYEFRCDCSVSPSADSSSSVELIEWLGKLPRSPDPTVYHDVIRAYLVSEQGGKLGDLRVDYATEIDTLTFAISMFYARIVHGDDLLELLRETREKQGVFREGFATNLLDIEIRR